MSLLLIMDALVIGVKGQFIWCIVFADGIVLISTITRGVSGKLDKRKRAIEYRGLQLTTDIWKQLTN